MFAFEPEVLHLEADFRPYLTFGLIYGLRSVRDNAWFDKRRCQFLTVFLGLRVRYVKVVFEILHQLACLLLLPTAALVLGCVLGRFEDAPIEAVPRRIRWLDRLDPVVETLCLVANRLWVDVPIKNLLVKITFICRLLVQMIKVGLFTHYGDVADVLADLFAHEVVHQLGIYVSGVQITHALLFDFR